METNEFLQDLAQAKAHGNVDSDIIALFEEGGLITESSISKLYFEDVIKTREDGSQYSPKIFEMVYNHSDGVVVFSYNEETNTFILPKLLKDKEKIQQDAFLYLLSEYIQEYFIRVFFDFTPFNSYLELLEFIFGEYKPEEEEK